MRQKIIKDLEKIISKYDGKQNLKNTIALLVSAVILIKEESEYEFLPYILHFANRKINKPIDTSVN